MSEIQESGCWPNAQQELLLRAALWPGQEAINAFLQWKAQIDIERLGAGSTRLLPLLRHNLIAQGFDDALLARCQSVARYSWYQNHMLFARSAKTLAALHAAGIDTMILKGSALIALHYRDFSLRPMNDFDILVPTSEFSRAVKVLEEQGWKPQAWRAPEMVSDDYFSFIHAHAFENREGNSLDLHRHILPQCCENDADDDFWRDAVATSVVETPTRALNAADTLLHICIHGVRWEGVHPLRWVADAMMILKSHDLDWNRLLEQSRKRHLHLGLHDALQYLKNQMRADVPDEVLNALQKLPTTRAQHIEYSAWTRDPESYGPLMKLWLRYRWFARWENAVGIVNPVSGFVRYLQLVWKLRHPWQIPLYAWTKAVRQARAWSRNRVMSLRAK